MKILKWLPCLLLSLMNINAQAAEFTPLLGVDLGYNYLKGQDNEVDKKGYSFGLKAIGSFKFSSLILDGSLGYQAQFFSADYIKIENYTPFSELSLRKMFGEKLSVGPMIQVQSGVYRTIPGVQEENGLLYNAGLQAVYHNENNGPRFEVSLLKSVSGINERNLYEVRLGVQFPLGKKEKPVSKVEPLVISAPTHQIKESDIDIPTIVVPGFISQKVYQSQDLIGMQMKLSGKILGFKIKSSELDSVSIKKLKVIANFIVVNKMKIGRIEISGFADKLGTEEYNKKLSEARAESVKKVFVDEGVAKTIEITTQGYGYEYPLMAKSSKYFSIKNRRTEIKFIDVVNNNALVRKLKQLIDKQ